MSTRNVRLSIFSQMIDVVNLNFKVKLSDFYSLCNCSKSNELRNVIFGQCLKVNEGY